MHRSEALPNLHEGEKGFERKKTLEAPKDSTYQTPQKYMKAMSFAGQNPQPAAPVVVDLKSLSDSGHHDPIHVGPSFASADHHLS